MARGVAETYLASLARSGIDTLILGCTHYPLLQPADRRGDGPVGHAGRLRRGDGARGDGRVSTATGSARPAGPGSTSFFVTDAPERFVRIGQRFLGSRVESAVRVER